MMAVMRRLVELEKEFCRATAEEVCLTRIAEELQREMEVLQKSCSARWRFCALKQRRRRMPMKGSSSSAAFATKFSPYLLVLDVRAVLVT
jgi:hypothetical protein